MAITFGLDAEFGCAPLANAAAGLIRTPATLLLGPIELTTRTDVSVGGSFHVHLSGLSSASIGTLDLSGVTDADLTDLADTLYAKLHDMTGCRAAIVRWSGGEDVLSPLLRGADLPPDEFPGAGDTGLVLADDLVDAFGLGGLFVPFDAGTRWIPHDGFRIPAWLRGT